eukprot:470364-Amphidinium_carterae.1
MASVGSPHASRSVVGTLAACCDNIMKYIIILSPMSASWMLRHVRVSHRTIGLVTDDFVATGSALADVIDTMWSSLNGSPAGVEDEKKESPAALRARMKSRIWGLSRSLGRKEAWSPRERNQTRTAMRATQGE